MEQKVWQAMEGVTSNDYTGNTIFICPVCNRGLHMCSKTTTESIRHMCPDCHIPLIYPWETEERSKIV